LGILCFSLILFGGYLIVLSIIRMRRFDRLIYEIKSTHSVIGRFIE
jgi:hypothetical protein